VAGPVRKLNKTEPQPPAEQAVPRQKSVVREYGEAIAIALALAVVLRTFIIQAYKIPSGSMEPTLLIGDHILVDKLAYGLRMPDSFFGLTPFADKFPYGKYVLNWAPVHRGDVVVFVFPLDSSKDFIKRVIGVAGDTVAVKAGIVYLNGKIMYDPHAHRIIPPQERLPASPRDYFGPVKVPPGELFVMGDNRDLSWDSRFWGFVPRHNVEGHAFIIYWSWDTDSPSLIPIRWRRFGMLIH
jgi:signal peptidase I